VTGYLHWKDFCDDELVGLARDAAIHNRQKFVDTTVTTGEPGHRQSKVCWHYDYPQLYDKLTNRIRSYLPDIIKAFPEVPPLPDVELQLTSHNTGDYFKRHLDNASEDTKMRVMTYVYYFTLGDEQKFSGGELVLETNNVTYTIQPTHNTIIMFPSGCWHEVRPVFVPSNRWEDSRMTCNGWIRRKL
jgi:SM-20-related protein